MARKSPSAASRPWAITRMREPKRSTSSSTWLDTTTHASGRGAEPAHEVDEVDPLPGVEAVERLVEHEDLGVVDEGGGHLDPLAVALGERLAAVARSAGSSSTSAEGGGRRRRGRRATPRRRGGGHHELAAPSCDSNSASCWGTRPIRPKSDRSLRGSPPSTRTRPCDGRASPHEQAQHGRLAGAVRTEQGGDAGTDLEGHVGDGHDVAEPLRHVVEADHRRVRAGGGSGERRRVIGSPPGGGSGHHSTLSPARSTPTLTATSSAVDDVVELAALAVDALHELERRRRQVEGEEPLGRAEALDQHAGDGARSPAAGAGPRRPTPAPCGR